MKQSDITRRKPGIYYGTGHVHALEGATAEKLKGDGLSKFYIELTPLNLSRIDTDLPPSLYCRIADDMPGNIKLSSGMFVKCRFMKSKQSEKGTYIAASVEEITARAEPLDSLLVLSAEGIVRHRKIEAYSWLDAEHSLALHMVEFEGRGESVLEERGCYLSFKTLGYRDDLQDGMFVDIDYTPYVRQEAGVVAINNIASRLEAKPLIPFKPRKTQATPKRTM